MEQTAITPQALTSNDLPTTLSPESLATIRNSPELYVRYCQSEQTKRLAWLTAKIRLIATILRITDYNNKDATIAATLVDGEIQEDDSLKNLTFPEINYALTKGSLGRYGDFYGLTARTIVAWLKGFYESELSVQATATINGWRLRSREQKEKEREQEERRKLFAEIEQAKKDGTFKPTHTFPKIGRPVVREQDLNHQAEMRKLAQKVLKGEIVLD